MKRRSSGFVNVDELMPQISVEQAAAFYGVALPELHRVGDEMRCRCFLLCGRDHETGDRALAIKADHPAKQWKCHSYGCDKGGNLISLCDLMKPGENMGGRPRGERFKAIAEDLKAMVGGVAATERPSQAPQPKLEDETPEKVNVPLAESENERARALVDLDAKFVVDPAEMPPAAASYFRHRPFLTPEVCRKWRMGYLPRDTGGDKRGGTMRGKIVYPIHNDQGEILTWFGRDPEFESKHQKWLAGGKQGKEPDKVRFVKGFHRSLELFGQEAFAEEVPPEKLSCGGIVLVEGPNDVIRLSELGQLSLGLCSNTISRHQAAKVAGLAEKFGGGWVTLMLDCDVEGEKGAKQALWELAECGARVQLVWSRSMHGGAYRDRQPESLSPEEWEAIRATLRPAADSDGACSGE